MCRLRKWSFADAIKVMAKVLYEREYVEKKEPIYDFYEMGRIMEESEPALKQFFTQLYLAARPSDRNMQTMDRMKNSYRRKPISFSNNGIIMLFNNTS